MRTKKRYEKGDLQKILDIVASLPVELSKEIRFSSRLQKELGSMVLGQVLDDPRQIKMFPEEKNV